MEKEEGHGGHGHGDHGAHGGASFDMDSLGLRRFGCASGIGRRDPYCWWKKSQTTTWDVCNLVKSGINYLSTGAGYLPSTVCLLFKVSGFGFLVGEFFLLLCLIVVFLASISEHEIPLFVDTLPETNSKNTWKSLVGTYNFLLRRCANIFRG